MPIQPAVRALARLSALVVVALMLMSQAAGAQEFPPSPAAGSKLLIQTKDGTFVEGRLSEARADSILLRKGKRIVALPVDSVRGAWTWRRDPVRGLAVGAGFGALVGALSGWAVPAECVSCDEARGTARLILRRSLIGAGAYGFSGFLNGILGGAWDVHPGLGGSASSVRGPPVSPWGLAVGIGVSQLLDRSRTVTSATIAGYQNDRPGSSTGVEVGILEFPQREAFDYSYVFRDSLGDSTVTRVVVQSEDAWTYGTIFLARSRGTEGAVRAQFLFGPAFYARHQASSSETIRPGVVLRGSGGSTRSSFGVMTGVGATFRAGDLRPALRARMHYVFSGRDHLVATLEAGFDFH